MKEKEEKPGYWAILPAIVRYDSSLSGKEIVLYAELSALTNKEGFCWASNSYFAGLYNVHKNTVSAWISKLEKRGHIKIEPCDTKSGELRKIWTLRDPSGKAEYPLQEKLNTPSGKAEYPLQEKLNTPSGKAEHNNKINIKNINNVLSEETSEETVVKAPRKDQHIVNVIEKFILVSPTASTKYGVPTWRRAAEDLIKFAGGEEQAKTFIDEFVKARERNMLYLPVIDSLVQMANKYASIRQVIGKEKNKTGAYNVKGSGYKYSDPKEI